MKSFLSLKKTTYFILLLPIIFFLGSFQKPSLENFSKNNYSSTQNGEYSPYGEQISMGGYHSAGVVRDYNDPTNDALYTWGDNSSGQLGLGNEKQQSTPQEVIDLPPGNIEQISMGWKHSAAVVNNGETDKLYTWGSNYYGQLGIGEIGVKNNPQKVDGLPGGEIEQISMGNKHSAAVVHNNKTETDELYMWGSNNQGQLGLGDYYNNDDYKSPKKVTALPEGEIEQIALGDDYSAAVVHEANDDKDHLYTWGRAREGQLGLGSGIDNYYNTPQEVTGLPEGDITQIATGFAHTAVIMKVSEQTEIDKGLKENYSNHLYTWGWNNDGQLGLKDNADTHNAPLEEVIFEGISSTEDITIEQVSLGDSYSTAIIKTTNGSHLYSWGNNDQGQMGIPNIAESNKPELVLNLPQDINQVSAGKEHASALAGDPDEKSKQTLYTWGDNGEGQLGLGSSKLGEDSDIPLTIAVTPTAPSFDEIEINQGNDYSTAFLNFSFSCGNTSFNEEYQTIDKLIVSDEEKGFKQEFEGDQITSSPPGGGKVHASVKLEDLNSGTTYTFKLEGTFISNDGKEKTICDSSAPEFKTLDDDIKPTAKDPKIKKAEVPIIGSTNAIITMQYDTGLDNEGFSYKMTSVVVSITDAAAEVTTKQTFREDEIKITDSGLVGGDKINCEVEIVNLEPDTEYSLSLEGTFESDSGALASDTYKIIDPFTTIEAGDEIDPTIESAIAKNVTADSATIEFTYNPGCDEEIEVYKLTSLTVTGDNDFESITFYSNKNEITIIDIDDKGIVTASIELKNLNPDTEYILNLKGFFETSTSSKTANFDSISCNTKPLNQSTPPEFINVEPTSIADTFATIEFSYNPGQDINNEPYELTALTITGDNDFKSITKTADEFYDCETKLNLETAKVDIENLVPDTSYHLKITGTFKTAVDETNDCFSLIEFTTLEEGKGIIPPKFTLTEVENRNATFVTIKLTYSYGHNDNAEPYEILNTLTISGNNDFKTVTKDQEDFYDQQVGPKETTLKVDLNDLKPSTNYELSLNGNFITSNQRTLYINDQYPEDVVTTIQFKTKKTNFSNWFLNHWYYILALILIIITIFILIIIPVIKIKERKKVY